MYNPCVLLTFFETVSVIFHAILLWKNNNENKNILTTGRFLDSSEFWERGGRFRH